MRGKATPRKCIDIPIALRTIGYIYRKKLRKTRPKTRFNKTLTAHFNKALTEFFCIHMCAWVCGRTGARASAGERAWACECTGRQAGAGVQAGAYVRVRARAYGCTHGCACAHVRAREHGLILPTLLYINPLPSVLAWVGAHVCACTQDLAGA